MSQVRSLVAEPSILFLLTEEVIPSNPQDIPKVIQKNDLTFNVSDHEPCYHSSMKKLLFLIIIIGGSFYLFKNDTEIKRTEQFIPTPTTFEPNPSSATFVLDEKSITLSNGQSVESGEEVKLLQKTTSGDLNNDGKKDSVLLLASSGGGSGIFIYIAAYISGPISYKGSNAIFIGDRISPQSISIENGVVNLKYLDRNPDEPFAAEPTIPVSVQFVYKNDSFQKK